MVKYRYIGKKLLNEDYDIVLVNGYMGNKVSFGSVVELNDFFASKAEKNPNYEKLKDSGSSIKELDEAPSDREYLVRQANKLGVKFRSNISDEKLSERIQSHSS